MPYTFVVQRVMLDGIEQYVASHPELELEAYGSSEGEARRSLEVIRDLYLADLAARGEQPPVPKGIQSQMRIALGTGTLGSGSYPAATFEAVESQPTISNEYAAA